MKDRRAYGRGAPRPDLRVLYAACMPPRSPGSSDGFAILDAALLRVGDLGRGGLRLRYPEPLAPGSLVHLQLRVPDSEDLFDARVEVLRSVPIPGEDTHIHTRFVDARPDVIRFVDRDLRADHDGVSEGAVLDAVDAPRTQDAPPMSGD
jgi:hypothetical protein